MIDLLINILPIIPIISTIIFFIWILKNRNELHKELKQICKIIKSKKFWKYVLSLDWLFKGGNNG